MTTAEAKQIATEWTHDYLASLPHAVGALFAGSINEKAEDAPFPDSSDIDIYIYLGPGGPPRPPKIPHRGLILEPSHHDAAVLHDLERLLGHPHQAPHVAAGHLIADPQGVLRQAHAAVRDEYPRLPHARARMKWAADNAAGKLGGCVDAQDWSPGLFCAFSLGLRNIAALCPIATLENPTLRRCFAFSKRILGNAGRPELHEELLDILGSAELSQNEARALVEPAMDLFRRAAAARKTFFWAQFELDPLAEPLFRGGLLEMIDAGDHREAMLYLQFIHYFCAEALTNDGTPEDRHRLAETMDAARSAFAGQDATGIRERSKRALDLLPRYAAACEEIARSQAGEA